MGTKMRIANPQKYKDIAEYLRNPLEDEEFRARLMAEQELEDIFSNQEAETKYWKAESAKAKQEKEEAQAKALLEQQQKENLLISLAKTMKKYNEPVALIMQQTGLDRTVIEAL